MKRILIIDDENGIHESLKMVLGNNLYIIDSALNEEEALNKLLAYNYALLICDYNLGTTKCTDLIFKIKKDGFMGKILMMSGNPYFIDECEKIKNDISAFYEKPFKDIFELKEQVMQLLAD
jgi:DNA-binding NtrC family response regulator